MYRTSPGLLRTVPVRRAGEIASYCLCYSVSLPHSTSFAAHLDSFLLTFQQSNPEGGWFYILISGDCPPLAAQGVAHCIRPSVSRICNERESERLREDRKRDSNAKQDGRTEESSKVAIERLWGKVERGRFVSNERAGSVRQRDSDCAAVGGLQLARMRGRSWDAL